MDSFVRGIRRVTTVSACCFPLLIGCANPRALTQDSASSRPVACEPAVGLNHFYVVLDEETFSAVRTSGFFSSDFAAVDAGLPGFGVPDSTSERLFVRGRNTYLELFRPSNRFGEPVGKVGIALGVDRPEDLDCVQRRWNERLGADAERSRIERQADGRSVPWYDAVYRPATSANADLVVWATAYRPEFLPWLYPHRPPSQTGVSRADFLAPRFDPERLLEDVTGLVVASPMELQRGISRQLGAIGYEHVQVGDLVVLSGGGWALTLTDPSGEQRGLLAVHFSTTREKMGLPMVRVGPRSLLVFGPGRRATWYFL